MINLGFYVSGQAGRLRKIIANPSYQEIVKATEIVVCDNLKNNDLKEKLLPLGIDYYPIAFEELDNDKTQRNLLLSNLIERLFKKHGVAYAFCFGERLLKGSLLKSYQNKIINFHPSLLPNFPGKLAIDNALRANSHLLGNTAHFVDDGMDTGPIIMQNVVSNEFFKIYGYEGVLDQQLIMLQKIFKSLESGQIQVEGSKVVIENANYLQSSFFPN